VRRLYLQVIALLPIPIILALVVWAGQRPLPNLPLTQTQKPAATFLNSGPVVLPLAPRPGWKLQGQPVRYDDKTLFDRIDGAAPVYLRAGFVYSLGAEYLQKGSKDPVVLDLYDMGTPSCALGMYATERDLSYAFIPVGDEGYLASGSLNFWQGRFYVKLAGFEQGKSMDQALTELAAALAQALPRAKEAAKDLSPLALLPPRAVLPIARVIPTLRWARWMG